MNPPVTLTVAGSDSSAGAGIQADLKAFAANGTYGVCAVTAIVAESPGSVLSIEAVAPDLLGKQLAAVSARHLPAAAKTGMLATASHVEVTADFFLRNPSVALVVDPVYRASAGPHLLDEHGFAFLKGHLLPAARLVTPNVAEAEFLLDTSITTRAEFESAPRRIAESFGCDALVTGGRFHGETVVTDAAWIDGDATLFSRQLLPVPDLHGTGCTLSAAIAARLASGEDLESAIRLARDYLFEAMRNHFSWGDADADAALNHFPTGIRVAE